MSIIKKITILLGIFFISGVAQVSAQEIKKIGKYKDWEAMVVMDADGKLFVAFRPNDNIKNEVSVTPGYEFNKNNSVTAASGKNKFKFDIKEQGFAWIADNKIELKMIKQMRKGSRIMITGYNQLIITHC